MAKKTVPVKPHKRKKPDAPKPTRKTVPVKPHKRTPPKD